MAGFIRRFAVLVLVATLGAGTFHAAGGSQVETPPLGGEPTPTPEQLASESYNEGLAYRDQAWRLQKKLNDPGTPENKREKLQKKVRNAYTQAIDEFRTAIGHKADFHQAYSSLGYAYRATGDYETALAAYGEALRLAPDYAEAIEYRGEAYLGLNRINEAQNAYRVLLEKDPKLAAELLGAMRAWVVQRRGEPAGVEAAQLDGFERWIDDRTQASAQSSSQRKFWSW